MRLNEIAFFLQMELDERNKQTVFVSYFGKWNTIWDSKVNFSPNTGK